MQCEPEEAREIPFYDLDDTNPTSPPSAHNETSIDGAVASLDFDETNPDASGESCDRNTLPQETRDQKSPTEG